MGGTSEDTKELVMPAVNETTRNLADADAGMRPDRRIDVVSLYPKDMNIYGDWGNVLTVMRRLSLYGYDPVLHE